MLLQHCQELVAQIDVTQGWGLAPQTKQRYARAVAAFFANRLPGNPVDTTKIMLTLRYYHSDHALVEALRDPNRPDHDDRWREWTQHALRILVDQSSSVTAAGAVENLDDLAQAALHDLWHSLDHFRFQSSFRTWAYRVISNCLTRYYRTKLAYKRQGELHAQSLDMLQLAGATIVEGSSSPDAIILGNVLADLVRQVLMQHPDERLAAIFERWARDDQTVREIGERMHLSPTRVHALLTKALMLLRNDPTLQDWARDSEIDGPDE